MGKTKITAGATLGGSNYGEKAKEVIASLESYKPNAATEKEWANVQHFVEDAVIRTSGGTVKGARQLLKITAVYVLWCSSEHGLPLQPEIIFAPLTIDAYCNRITNDGTRGTYRASLMRVSATLVPEANPPAMTPVKRRTIQPPYNAEEMKRYRSWARGQHTLNNRHKAIVMLALSAGAGLWPTEIDLVLREDIVADDFGVVVVVRGENPREVPVLRQWEDWLLEVAKTRAIGEPMFGSITRGHDKSLLNAFTARTVGEAPTNSRLRATWIVEHIALATPMQALFRAGGFKQMGNLHQYLAYVDNLNEVEYRARLRGKASE